MWSLLISKQKAGQRSMCISSDNILKQATSLKNYRPELLLPGITITTAPNDYETFDQLRLATFDGKTWAADKTELAALK